MLRARTTTVAGWVVHQPSRFRFSQKNLLAVLLAIRPMEAGLQLCNRQGMPYSTIEDMEMSESDSKQPRHGRVTNPESRGSYAIKKGLLLEWEVVAMEGGKNFPDLEPGLAHDFPGDDEPKFDPTSAAKPPADGFILSGGQNEK
ncbi:Chitin-binding protein, partial [Pseudomonas amygdali pv. tabaci]